MGREIIEEGEREREREATAGGTARRERGDSRNRARGRVWKELRHQAAEENLSKSFA